MNEIFVASFKYLQVWTTDCKELVETLNKYNISEQEDLNFIDEFPVISETLSANKFSGVRHYSDVIGDIESEFANL